MSPAGLVYVCNVIRFSYPADDIQGGALPSGTTLYQNIDIRIKSERPTQALVEQGLQVPEIYSALIHEGNIDVRENDQIEITRPALGWFYQKKFRVLGVQRSSNHPFQDRNQIRLTLRRYDQSHSNELQ